MTTWFMIIFVLSCFHQIQNVAVELEVRGATLSPNGSTILQSVKVSIDNILTNNSIITFPIKFTHSDEIIVFDLKITDNLIDKMSIFCNENTLDDSHCVYLLENILETIQIRFDIPLDLPLHDDINMTNSNLTNILQTTDNTVDNPAVVSLIRLKKVSEINSLCSTASPTTTTSTTTTTDNYDECFNLKYNYFKKCWIEFNNNLNKRFWYTSALQILNNEHIPFFLEIPQNTPIGMGNVMKGLITFLSFHKNTKLVIQANHNYSTILDRSHWVTEEDKLHLINTNNVIINNNNNSSNNNSDNNNIDTYDDNNNIQLYQSVFTWDWLILKSEEYLFANIQYVHCFEDPFLAVFNPLLSILFNNEISINAIFDRSLLPQPIVKRILNAKRKIKFHVHIVDMSYNITDQLIPPSLGVSIRSWNASHESHTNVAYERRFNLSAYREIITTIVDKHNIRSILIAYDNPILAHQINSFLINLKIPYYSYDNSLSQSELDKPAVEMLSLSRTQVLLGDARSTFLQAIYWFGDCQQTVYHPYDYNMSMWT